MAKDSLERLTELYVLAFGYHVASKRMAKDYAEDTLSRALDMGMDIDSLCKVMEMYITKSKDEVSPTNIMDMTMKTMTTANENGYTMDEVVHMLEDIEYKNLKRNRRLYRGINSLIHKEHHPWTRWFWRSINKSRIDYERYDDLYRTLMKELKKQKD